MEYTDENMVLVDYWHADTDVLVSSYEVVEHVGKADGSASGGVDILPSFLVGLVEVECLMGPGNASTVDVSHEDAYEVWIEC